MLARAVDGPIVVVRAPGQELPDLPVASTRPKIRSKGSGRCRGSPRGCPRSGPGRRGFVCSTDLPFLHPAYVRPSSASSRSRRDLVLPTVRGFRQPLAAGYRTALTGLIEAQLAAENLRPGMLLRALLRVCGSTTTRCSPTPRSRRLDPALDSVLNVNTPDEYEPARARPAPEVTVECFGALAGADRPRSPTVRGRDAGGRGRGRRPALDRHVMAAINGDQIVRDPLLPLVAGDTVAFLSADAGG